MGPREARGPCGAVGEKKSSWSDSLRNAGPLRPLVSQWGMQSHPSGTRREAEEMELLQASSEAWSPCLSLLCSSGDSDLGVKASS